MRAEQDEELDGPQYAGDDSMHVDIPEEMEPPSEEENESEDEDGIGRAIHDITSA